MVKRMDTHWSIYTQLSIIWSESECTVTKQNMNEFRNTSSEKSNMQSDTIFIKTSVTK